MQTAVGGICLKLLRDANCLKLLLPVFITLKLNAEGKNGYKIEHMEG